jgi:Peptidase family M28/Secretion system C-terminal sorting domain/Fibronectin type III domain
MRLTFLTTILLLFVFQLSAQNSSSYIDSLITKHIEEVNQDSIFSYVKSLQDFGSRHALNENRKEVATWIKNKFQSFGIENVVIDSFYASFWDTLTWQYNVVATIPGSNPDYIYAVGAHHDAISTIDSCPGADDNASGTAAALEIARCVTKLNYTPEATYKFMTFAAEEEGLNGSHYLAQKSRENNEDIRLMINNDMIGNANTEDWNTTIYSYSNARDFARLADDLYDEYTSVNGVLVQGNSFSSDSYAFFLAGFPTIFFIEQDFSPVYHQFGDLVDTMNFEYLKENVKLSYALLLQISETPVTVNNLVAFDVGDGQSIELSWNASIEDDIKGYIVKYYKDENFIDSLFTETSSVIIENLEEDIEFEFEVAAIDNLNNLGFFVSEKIIPTVVPNIPLHADIFVSKENVKIVWEANTELDLAGYNVYRTDIQGSTPDLLNTSLVEETFYIDNQINPGEVYHYYVTAIDNDNNESFYTEELTGTLISFSEGVLIVDDSRGGIGNPSEAIVDGFYESLFSDRDYTHHDVSEDGDLGIVDFGQYSSILWHINSMQVDKPLLYDVKNHLKKYLEAGGNLMVTLYEASKDVEWNNEYPRSFHEGDFIYDYLKIENIQYDPKALFAEAITESEDYVNMSIDSTKTLEANQFHFNRVEAIIPNEDGETIFSYGTEFSNEQEEGILSGTSVGVEYLGNDFQTITLSFPLYYMNVFRAQQFIDEVFDHKFNINVAIDQIVVVPEMNETKFNLYPNPCSSDGNISFDLEQDDDIYIDIISSYGAIIKNIYSGKMSAGNQIVGYNINELNAGIYFVRLKNSNFVQTQKLIIGN